MSELVIVFDVLNFLIGLIIVFLFFFSIMFALKLAGKTGDIYIFSQNKRLKKQNKFFKQLLSENGIKW